jgi:hypothetical protein
MIQDRRYALSWAAAIAGLLFPAMAAMQQWSAGSPVVHAFEEPPSTIAKPTTSELSPDEEGFIRRWLVLEPIAAGGLTQGIVQAEVRKEYFPGQFTAVPGDGDRITVEGADLTWHALDTKLYNINLYHFARALGKPTSNVLFWAVTVVDCPKALEGVRLAIGSNAASVWWVNGKEVIGIYGDRQTVIDDGVSKKLKLQEGPNIVRTAVVNGGGATDFCARFLSGDDVPVKAFTVNLGRFEKSTE